jgi:hypothetical protein
MTIFELVKAALDEMYEEGKEEYGEELDKTINERLEYLSDSYTKLTQAGRIPLNYTDPATRFGYVYRYSSAHGDYLTQVLQETQADVGAPLFDKEELSVTCIGGGPGSDIIGLMKYLELRKGKEPVRSVTCYLMDKEQAWSDTWMGVGQQMDFGVTLNVHVLPLDVTNAGSWKTVKNPWKADLFTMSYFVSEVYSLDEKTGVVTEFWKRVFERARAGAMFLYNDNDSPRFTDYFDELCNGAKLQTIYASRSIKTPSPWEQKDGLAHYLELFGPPKLKAQLAYRLLRKETAGSAN